jgi:hypothetical protein
VRGFVSYLELEGRGFLFQFFICAYEGGSEGGERDSTYCLVMGLGSSIVVHDAVLTFPDVEGVCLPKGPCEEQVSCVVEGDVCEFLVGVGA